MSKWAACAVLFALLSTYSAFAARIEPHPMSVGEYKVLRDAAANAKERTWPWLAYEASMSALFDGVMLVENSGATAADHPLISFCLPSSMKNDEMKNIYKRLESETEIASADASDGAILVLVLASHLRFAFPCNGE